MTDEERYNEWKESSIDILGGSDYSVKAAALHFMQAEREACAKVAENETIPDCGVPTEEAYNMAACDECSPENYGWVFNRVEGRRACTCMLEAEPFQILLKALDEIAKKQFIHGAEAQSVALSALRSVLPLDYIE